MLTGFHMDTQRLYANIRIAVPLCVLSFEKTPFQQEVWPQPLFQPEMYNSFSQIHVTLKFVHFYLLVYWRRFDGVTNILFKKSSAAATYASHTGRDRASSGSCSCSCRSWRTIEKTIVITIIWVPTISNRIVWVLIQTSVVVWQVLCLN